MNVYFYQGTQVYMAFRAMSSETDDLAEDLLGDFALAALLLLQTKTTTMTMAKTMKVTLMMIALLLIVTAFGSLHRTSVLSS